MNTFFLDPKAPTQREGHYNLRPVNASEKPSCAEIGFGAERTRSRHTMLPTFPLSATQGAAPPTNGPRIFLGWNTEGGSTHTPIGRGGGARAGTGADGGGGGGDGGGGVGERGVASGVGGFGFSCVALNMMSGLVDRFTVSPWTWTTTSRDCLPSFGF